MYKETITLTDDQLEAMKVIALGDYDDTNIIQLYLYGTLASGVEKIVHDRKANIGDALLNASAEKQAQVAQILELDPATFEAVQEPE